MSNRRTTPAACRSSAASAASSRRLRDGLPRGLPRWAVSATPLLLAPVLGLAGPAAAESVASAPTGSAASAAPASGHAATGVAARTPQPHLNRKALRSLLAAMTASGATGATPVGVTEEIVTPWGRFDDAAGSADLSTRAAADRHDVVRVASMTKAMVSVLALQEVQSGRWTLNTTVGQVLPGLLPGHDDVTLQQLLSHTSGLPDFDTALVAGVDTVPDLLKVIARSHTDADLVATATAQPWAFTPGTRFAYSNTNYVVVGMMLRHVTGKDIPTLLRDRVFRPARMHDSSFPTAPGLPARALTEYARFGDGAPVALSGFDPTWLSSAGAVLSTPRDLNRFYAALLQGRLVSRRLVTVMTTPTQASLSTKGTLPYGLGVYLVPDPCPAPGASAWLVGHDGASFGTLTLEFSSFDAKRQVSLSYTGRDYTGSAEPTVNAAVGGALAATCAPTRAASATASAGGRAAAAARIIRTTAAVPWIDSRVTSRASRALAATTR